MGKNRGEENREIEWMKGRIGEGSTERRIVEDRDSGRKCRTGTRKGRIGQKEGGKDRRGVREGK